MPTISLFLVEPVPTINEIIAKLDKKKIGETWFRAKRSKFLSTEVEIDYFFYESLEDNLKKVVNGEEYYDIISVLTKNGNYSILRKVVCYFNEKLGLLEICRGHDEVTKRLKTILEKILEVRLLPVSMNSEELVNLIRNHSVELRQAMFKNVDGFWYTILRGSHLEKNSKFSEYLLKNHNSLRVISIRPKIRFLRSRYTVTINGDKGTLKFFSGSIFKWRPRFEIRQMIFIIASMIGLI